MLPLLLSGAVRAVLVAVEVAAVVPMVLKMMVNTHVNDEGKTTE